MPFAACVVNTVASRVAGSETNFSSTETISKFENSKHRMPLGRATGERTDWINDWTVSPQFQLKPPSRSTTSPHRAPANRSETMALLLAVRCSPHRHTVHSTHEIVIKNDGCVDKNVYCLLWPSPSTASTFQNSKPTKLGKGNILLALTMRQSPLPPSKQTTTNDSHLHHPSPTARACVLSLSRLCARLLLVIAAVVIAIDVATVAAAAGRPFVWKKTNKSKAKNVGRFCCSDEGRGGGNNARVKSFSETKRCSFIN